MLLARSARNGLGIRACVRRAILHIGKTPSRRSILHSNGLASSSGLHRRRRPQDLARRLDALWILAGSKCCISGCSTVYWSIPLVTLNQAHAASQHELRAGLALGTEFRSSTICIFDESFHLSVVLLCRTSWRGQIHVPELAYAPPVCTNLSSRPLGYRFLAQNVSAYDQRPSHKPGPIITFDDFVDQCRSAKPPGRRLVWPHVLQGACNNGRFRLLGCRWPASLHTACI